MWSVSVSSNGVKRQKDACVISLIGGFLSWDQTK